MERSWIENGPDAALPDALQSVAHAVEGAIELLRLIHLAAIIEEHERYEPALVLHTVASDPHVRVASVYGGFPDAAEVS